MYNKGSDQVSMSSITKNPPQQMPSPPPYNSYPTPEQSTYSPPQQSTYPPPQQSIYPPRQSITGAYPPPHIQQQPTTHTTTVVIQQQPAPVVIQGPRAWSTGLCACGDDCGICCLGWCCPGILACTVSSKAGECCCVASACPIALRTKIRTKHNIQGDIMGDCCIMWCCGPCALCQMARELNRTQGI